MPSDKQISQLPAASAVQTSDYLAIEQGGEAKKASGEIFRAFAVGAVTPLVTQAQTAAATAVSAKDDAVAANTAAQSAKDTAVSSATTAVSAKDDAVAANTAAQSAKDTAVSSKEAAQTAAATAVSAKEDAEEAADLAEEAWEHIETKADIDGTYDSFTAGFAKEILSDLEGPIDEDIYLYRKTGGSLGRKISGIEKIHSITGASVAWNQLVQNGDFSSTDGWTIQNGTATVSGKVITVTASGANPNINRAVTYIADHVYIWLATVKTSVDSVFAFGNGNSALGSWNTTANTWLDAAFLRKASATGFTQFRLYFDKNNAMSSGATANAKNCMLVDVTQMLGVTIAEHVYSLETASTGSGIAFLKENFPGLFDIYHDYNAGEIVSCKAEGFVTTGINQWDEQWEQGSIDINTGNTEIATTRTRSKNYIPVFPNTKYRFVIPTFSSGNAVNDIIYYGSDKSYVGYNTPRQSNSFEFTTPSNCYYIKFHTNPQYGGTYQNNISINYPSTDTQYHPYSGHSYILENTDLRGIMHLTSATPNGKLYYDGDIYTPGKIRRKFGIVDLGTLPWNYTNATFYTGGISSSAKANGASKCSSIYKSSSSGADKTIFIGSGAVVYVYDADYTSAASFKAAMSGVQLLYELATEVVEDAYPYAETMHCDENGFEYFIDNRSESLPFSVITEYPDSIDIAGKADIDGSYDGLTAGYAKDILSSKGDSDDAAYLIRKSGGDVDIYDTEVVKEIEGASIAWNQQIENGDFSDGTTGWSKNSTATMSVVDNVLNLSMASSTSANRIWGKLYPTTISGHKYFLSADLWAGSAVGGYIVLNATGTTSDNIDNITTTRKTYSHIVSSPSDDGCITIGSRSSLASDTILYIANVNAIDLTLMLGPAVADAIYAMETASAGSGVAFLKTNFPGLFSTYHPYNKGELVHVQTKGRVVTGINQWDEEWEVGGIDLNTGSNNSQTNVFRTKNHCVCSPSATYYLGTNIATIFWYTANGTFISYQYNNLEGNVATAPSNAGKFRFITKSSYGTTYHNDICINISDPSINGQYFSYEEETYEHSDLPLRGLYKIEDGKLTTYGDIYKPSGKVKRRFGLVDLGTLTYTRNANYANPFFSAPLPSDAYAVTDGRYATVHGVTDLYSYYEAVGANENYWGNIANKAFCLASAGVSSTNKVYIRDDTYSTTADLQDALKGHYLLYELATETEEETAPYQENQKIFEGGTESFIDERDIPLPVGINAFFPIPTVSKLDALPFATGTDGLYILEEEGKSLSLKSFDEAVELAIEKGIVARPIEEDISNVSIANFPDGAENVNVKELTVGLDVVQNFNGYSNPWPGGGGKNKFKTVFDASETTAQGNTLVKKGITAVIQPDGKIKFSGTSGSGGVTFLFGPICTTITQGNHSFSVSGDTTGIHKVQMKRSDNSSGTNPSYYDLPYSNYWYDDDEAYCWFSVWFLGGSTVNTTIGLQYEESEQYTDWEPYANICPILPVTEVEVTATGRNLFDEETMMPKFGFTKQSDGTWYIAQAGSSPSLHLWDNIKGYTGQITITINVKYASAEGWRFKIWYTDGTSTPCYPGTGTEFHVKSFTSTSGKIVTYITRDYGSNVASTVKYLQIELDSTAHDYEPFVSTHVTDISINQWDEVWENGIIDANGADQPNASRIRSKNYIPCMAGTQYYSSRLPIYVRFYDASKTFVSRLDITSNTYNPFTAPSGAVYMRFCMDASYGATYLNDISVNFPSRFTSYYPYTGNVVYGGELDVTTGVLTARYASVDLGTLTWTLNSGSTFWAIPTGKLAGIDNFVCSEYATTTADIASMANCTTTGRSANQRVYIRDDRYTDAATFKAAMSGVQLVYELATPISIQLTPTEVKTLLKNNIIYSDSGDILKLTYRADIKAYIDKKLSN